MKDATVTAIIDAFLHDYLSHFGVLQVITTYQEAQFESYLLSQFFQFTGCQRHRTSSYHPQSNGLVKNSHRRLKTALRMQVNPQYHNFPSVLLSIRNTPKPEIDCCSVEC